MSEPSHGVHARQRAHRGDLVVLIAPPHATRAEVEAIADHASTNVPAGIRMLVVGGGMRVHIARAARTPRRGATPRWAR